MTAVVEYDNNREGEIEVTGAELWVVHAFQKKSTQGIKTPKHEIDLVAARVKRLKEMFR